VRVPEATPPIPFKESVALMAEDWAANATVPLKSPELRGVKRTQKRWLPPGGSVKGVRISRREKFAPPTVALETVTECCVRLVILACRALVPPRETCPKDKVFGVIASLVDEVVCAFAAGSIGCSRMAASRGTAGRNVLEQSTRIC
jgi:hypothetical protein